MPGVQNTEDQTEMHDSKRIVCLANSRKLAGRCVAGRAWFGERAGDWIRPVSERKSREVSEYERQYEDGSDPRVLDIIDVPLVGKLTEDGQTEKWQTENWLLDAARYWRKAGAYPRSDLPDLVDPVRPLWLSGFHTYNGENDQIPLQRMAEVSNSLRLIEVDELELRVFAPGEAFGNRKRRVQGRFGHSGLRYALWVTDPRCEQRYLARPDGDYSLGRRYLTISLGEPFQEHCYKLIAAIIEHP